MLYRELEAFCLVAERKSFTAAALSLGISQSAVSQLIKKLESRLGITLLIRRNRSFVLTEAGEYLAREGRKLLTQTHLACESAVRIARSRRRELRIGCLSGLSGAAVRKALAAFAQENKGLEITVRSGTHEALYALLLEHQIDMVVSDQRRVFSDDFANIVIANPAVMIEAAASSPLAGKPRLEAADLADFPCIVATDIPYQPAERSYYSDLLGFRGRFIFVSSQEEARLTAAAGRGFRPLLLPGDAADGAVRIPLEKDGAPVTFRICAFWHKADGSDVTERFAAALKASLSADGAFSHK
jgi:DNA-binding transcriptional LysR family regulator